MPPRHLFTLRSGHTRLMSLIHLEGSRDLDFIIDVPERNVPLNAEEALRLAEALIRWARKDIAERLDDAGRR